MIESLIQSELSTLMASEKRGLAARAWNQRPLEVCVSITWFRFPFYFAFGKTAERKPTTFKEEHSNLNSISQQSPTLSLHSAKRRLDMIESDSIYGQTKRFLTIYLRILPYYI